ncbi:AAA family ATPase [Leucothrix pacifica]|uniref:ATPase AAA-type core domain-containing protein n=1 Tax=Leucothrix pacifica TaxID=1247513 RepID=A0A317C1I9_9GAMM|nr:ATP-binding protein [Leucothrix pacifica]PWQ92408.1 hypothetical protein DKW60_21310 [Leucothrix pacifica]
MILRFGCENFRSISEYQEVLLTAVSKDDGDTLFSPNGIREKVLPIVAFYGANGSGKTNLIMSIRSLISAVAQSASSDIDRALIPAFKLDRESANLPSTLDMDFIFDDVHYHYGFSFDGKVVTAEWLYSFSYAHRMSKSVLFDRDISDKNSPFYFGKSLKGKNKVISEITGEASLFLSVAAKSKHKLLSNIFEYIKSHYSFRFNSGLLEEQVAQKIRKYGFEREISRFLTLVDVGVARLEAKQVQMEEDRANAVNSMLDALVNSLGDLAPKGKLPLIEYQHHIEIHRENKAGEDVLFSFNDESLGTQALISLLVSVFWVLKHGGVFVVDEIESSLHTKLSLKVVELFNSKVTNPNGAQLIFTTHETQLLNYNGIRRDEVWLTEKSLDGSTKVAPLSDYSIDKRSNLRNGYLDGRFGAIPFLSLLDDFRLFEE